MGENAIVFDRQIAAGCDRGTRLSGRSERYSQKGMGLLRSSRKGDAQKRTGFCAGCCGSERKEMNGFEEIRLSFQGRMWYTPRMLEERSMYAEETIWKEVVIYEIRNRWAAECG